jgi:hypothetical protein
MEKEFNRPIEESQEKNSRRRDLPPRPRKGTGVGTATPMNNFLERMKSKAEDKRIDIYGFSKRPSEISKPNPEVSYSDIQMSREDLESIIDNSSYKDTVLKEKREFDKALVSFYKIGSSANPKHLDFNQRAQLLLHQFKESALNYGMINEKYEKDQSECLKRQKEKAYENLQKRKNEYLNHLTERFQNDPYYGQWLMECANGTAKEIAENWPRLSRGDIQNKEEVEELRQYLVEQVIIDVAIARKLVKWEQPITSRIISKIRG